MKSNYDDAEQAALIKLAEMLASEVTRATRILIADLNHLAGCESTEHRAGCIKQAKECVQNLLNSLRYAAWIEAEMSEIRIFECPQKNVEQIEESLNEIAAQYAPKPDPTVEVPVVDIALPAAPEIEIVPPEQMIQRVQEIKMDEQATAPYPTTKQ